MATCDRECETCQYCVSCPISCTAAAIERRERKAGKAAKLGYNRMNDGRQTYLQIGHVATCTGLFKLVRTWKYNIDENTTAGEIWDTIADQEAD